ncbi:MAG: PP2C family serine/threonine-protein phosphatase [Anaerolineales bacterium]
MKKDFFSWLHIKKTKPASTGSDINTVPLPESQVEGLLANVQNLEPQQFIYGCGQSIGKQRDHNEDSVFALSIAIGGEKSSYPLGLYVVADGMGGHQYGEVASSAAARTLAGSLLKHFLPYLVNPSSGMDESLQELMRSAINDAQKAVTQAAPGSGTTLTAALVLGQQMTIGHVGDSRAYAIHQYGGGEILTRDHSLVKRLEELGQISPEEAAVHPQRNVLYRALGQGEVLEPDIFTAPFPQSGYLLLCSDGLWSVLSDSTIFTLVNAEKDLQRTCQSLVDAANEAGGPDNISVIVVQLKT